MQVKTSFHWKSLTADKFAKLLEGVDNPTSVAALYDVTEKDGIKSYKRKSVETELSLPEWVLTIPKLAQEAVTDLVAGFVRFAYLDQFAPIGAHDWETVEKELAAAGGGRKKLDFTDELLAAVAASFGAYIGQSVNSPVVGERLKEAANAKFSMAALQKHLNAANEEIIQKLQTRLNSWAAWLAENDADKAEEMASVYEYLAGRLAKNLEKLKDVPENIGDIL